LLAVRSPSWLRGFFAERLRSTLALSWLLCLLASLFVTPLRHTAQARADLDWLRRAVEDYAINVGRPPRTLGELRFRTIERFGMAAPRDPWGRSYRYREPAGGKSWSLSSDGPDGVPSEDDL
jgi:hypothetical protein